MRIAVPNKGRLHEPAVDLLERAGLRLIDGADRKLYADTVDPEVSVLFARAADIPEYVADGAAALANILRRGEGEKAASRLNVRSGCVRSRLARTRETVRSVVSPRAGAQGAPEQ